MPFRLPPKFRSHPPLAPVLDARLFAVPPTANPAIPPETYRLPKTGVDPHFGCTRPFYYALEKAGRIRLIRIRGRGKIRGITLVPYDEMKRLIHEAAAE